MKELHKLVVKGANLFKVLPGFKDHVHELRSLGCTTLEQGYSTRKKVFLNKRFERVKRRWKLYERADSDLD